MRKKVAYKANWYLLPPDGRLGCIAEQFVLYDTFARVCDSIMDVLGIGEPKWL
jgi:chlorite dismutase